MTYTHTQAPPIPKHRPQEPKKYPYPDHSG